MTREKDVYVSLQARASFANSRKAVCYISVHNNAGGGKGCEFIYYPTSAGGKRLAECIRRSLTEGTGQVFRRFIARDDADVRLTQMPAVIVECAFMDNAEDYKLIATDAACRKMGEAIGKGVQEWLR